MPSFAAFRMDYSIVRVSGPKWSHFFMIRVRVRVIMVYDVTPIHAQFVHHCTASDGLFQKAAPVRNISIAEHFRLIWINHVPL